MHEVGSISLTGVGLLDVVEVGLMAETSPFFLYFFTLTYPPDRLKVNNALLRTLFMCV